MRLRAEGLPSPRTALALAALEAAAAVGPTALLPGGRADKAQHGEALGQPPSEHTPQGQTCSGRPSIRQWSSGEEGCAGGWRGPHTTRGRPGDITRDTPGRLLSAQLGFTAAF